MSKMKNALKGNMRQYAMIIALFVVVVMFQILTKGTLLMPLNISNIIQQNSYIMILACGMLLCILTGGNVDLSVGSIVGFVGAISAVLMLQMHLPTIPAILISLAIGLAIGCWNGFWIAYVGVPAFIATLAGQLLFRGFTMGILKGVSLAPLPNDYTFMATSFLPDPLATDTLKPMTLIIAGIAISAFIVSEYTARRKRQSYGFEVPSMGIFLGKILVISATVGFFAMKLAQYRGIPMALILVAALVLLYSFIAKKTVLGRHTYAIGGNMKAAKLSGVKTKRVLFFVYANMGLLAAVAGIIFTGRLNSATPKGGVGFELDAIASCFIGGASTAGGIGTIVGAIVGSLLMGVLNNGMNILGVSIDWQQAIKGAVLLVAVGFDILSKKKSNA